MRELLRKIDWSLIQESLRYTEQAFEDYKHYPSYEFKKERINEVRTTSKAITKLKRLIKNG